MKLGYGDRKTSAPTNPQEVTKLLAEMMSAALNGEIEFDQAKIALNAATRIADIMQADTRMKMAAHAMGRQIADQKGWQAIEHNDKTIEASDAKS